MKNLYKELIIGVSMFAASASASYAVIGIRTGKNSKSGENTTTEQTSQYELTPQEKFLSNLTSMDYVTADLSMSVFNAEGLEMKLSVKNIQGFIDIENTSNIKLSADLKLKIDHYSLEASVGYFDGTVFLDYNDSHLMLETSNLGDVITMLPTFDFGFEIPEEFANLNTDALTEEIQTMDELMCDGQRCFKFHLTENLPIFFKTNENYEFIGAFVKEAEVMGFTINIDCNLNNVTENDVNLVNPLQRENAPTYQNFSFVYNVIDAISDIFESKKAGYSLAVNVGNQTRSNLVDVQGNIQYDLENTAVDADLNIIENSRNHNIGLHLSDDVLYADYNTLKVSIEKATITTLIDYAKTKIPSTDVKAVLDKLVEKVGSMDFIYTIKEGFKVNDLIKSISADDLHFALVIDPNILGISGKDITVAIALDSEHKISSLTISDITIMGYTVALAINKVNYKAPTFDKASYSKIEPVLGVLNSVSKLVEQKQFRLEVAGSVQDTTSNAKATTFSGGVQFDIDDKFGYGDLTIIDANDYSHNLKADMRTPEDILVSYNNTMNAKFRSSSLIEIYEMCSKLFQDKDEHFMELFGDLFERMESTPLMQALKGNLEPLLGCNILNSFAITDNYLEMDISGAILGYDDVNVDVKVNYTEDALTGLEVSANISGTSIALSVNLKEFNSELDATRLSKTIDMNSVMDFSDLALLLEFGLNTTRFNYYRFSGSIVLDFSNSAILGSLFKGMVNIDADLRVRNNHGDVQVALELTNLPTTLIFGCEELNYSTEAGSRSSSLYYEHKTFYLTRSENISKTISLSGKTSYKYTQTRRVTRQDFIDNIISYFLGDLVGLKQTYINLITDSSSSSSSSSIKYEEIVSNFSSTGHQFDVTVAVGKLAGTDLLGDLFVSIGASSDNVLTYVKANMAIINTLNFILDVELMYPETTRDLTDANRLVRLEKYIPQHINDTLGEKLTSKTAI